MEINNLKKRFIVNKDEHFFPALSMAALAGTALVGKIANELAQQIRRNNFSQSQLLYVDNTLFTNCREAMDRNELIMSTNDITF